jgi:hypothetical protein
MQSTESFKGSFSAHERLLLQWRYLFYLVIEMKTLQLLCYTANHPYLMQIWLLNTRQRPLCSASMVHLTPLLANIV